MSTASAVAGGVCMPIEERLQPVVEERGDAVVYRPGGDLDLTRASSLRDQLREILSRNPERLIIDLGEVDYVDSPIVATLIEAMQIARRRACLLVVCGVRPFVRSVFEISRVYDTVFVVAETVDEAMELPNRRRQKRIRPDDARCDLGKVIDLS
ncbi:MAG: STAS domain-containing protein, partial [Planctomycetota bacterium]